MSSSILGPILGADVVQGTLIAHLKDWMPTYLVAIDEERGLTRGYTAWPKSWQVVPVFDNTLQQQLPAMLVICPGTADKPRKEGDGSYRVTYAVGVAALVKGPDQLTANKIAKRYGAAISLAVLQEKGRIHPNIHGVSWDGETYDDILPEVDRTLSSATVHFSVEFSNVLNEQVGPAEPIVVPDPLEEPPTDPITEQLPSWGVIPDEDHITVTIQPREES
jgi:hypothetical protein